MVRTFPEAVDDWLVDVTTLLVGFLYGSVVCRNMPAMHNCVDDLATVATMRGLLANIHFDVALDTAFEQMAGLQQQGGTL